MGILPQKKIHDNLHIQELVSALRDAAAALLPSNAGFTDREAATMQLANEAIRECLEQDLQGVADEHGVEVIVDGKLYHRHQSGTVAYHSLCGSLTIERWTYRRVGERNGPTIVPLELAAGLIHGATPAMAFSVAQGYAKGHMRGHLDDLNAAHRVPPSRTTLEHMAKSIGTEVSECTARIEPMLRRSETVPQGACAVSVGLDRTSVPMEEERAPDQLPNSRRKKRRKPYLRSAPAPIDVHYRMAYIGTFCITDKDGETLLARRYAVPAFEGPTSVVERVMADLQSALKQRPELHVGVVQDGAPELWGLMWTAMNAEPLVKRYHQAYDRYHISERLAEMLKALEPDETKRREIRHRWERSLDRRCGAIKRIIQWIEEKARSKGPRFYDTLREQISFFIGVEWRMQYAKFRKLGLPVGSGVTEGACKFLIAARAKRSGQRWRPKGISAVLALRSLLHSERLQRFWNVFAQRHEAEVLCSA